MNKLIALAFSCLIFLTSNAQFSGGAGTEKSPYLVSNAYELSDVRNYPLCYFKQIDNIDLTEWIQDNSPQKGWAPIGTESQPFRGSFDGGKYCIKGLIINRPETDNAGLFGCVDGDLSVIKNIRLEGPGIEAASNVGFICGNNKGKTIISDCAVNGGIMSADSIAGGIVGQTNYIVHDCYVFAEKIVAKQNCGGIVGITIHDVYSNYVYANLICDGNAGGIVGKSYNHKSCWGEPDTGDVNGRLFDCRFDGSIISKSNAGGIIGWNFVNHHYSDIASYKPLTYYHDIHEGLEIDRCLVGNGSITASGNACGIVGYRESCINVDIDCGSQTRNSVCAISTIDGNRSFRIQDKVGGVNNIASINTKFIINGYIESAIDDNEYNGVAYGEKTLTRASTYKGLGWDFLKIWTIEEGIQLPYLKFMSEKPDILDYKIGGKGFIRGKCSTDGKIKIVKNGVTYTGDILDGVFEMNIGVLEPQDRIYFNAEAPGKFPSITQFLIIEKQDIKPVITAGDANGDGVVDAADVVGIINHIIGKTSATFNVLNADINGDGQVLVDDAVGAVELIMKAQ